MSPETTVLLLLTTNYFNHFHCSTTKIYKQIPKKKNSLNLPGKAPILYMNNPNCHQLALNFQNQPPEDSTKALTVPYETEQNKAETMYLIKLKKNPLYTQTTNLYLNQ